MALKPKFHKPTSKSARTEIVTRTPSRLRNITPEKIAPGDDTKKLLTIFEQRRRDIEDRIEAGDDSESTTLEIAKALMSAIIGALPNFEEKLKTGSGRDAYAFVALADMMLKLSNELRALQDRSVMSKVIMKKIIRPQLEALASQITANINGVKNKLPDNSRVASDALTGAKEAAAISIGEIYVNTGNALSQYFGGSEGSFRGEFGDE